MKDECSWGRPEKGGRMGVSLLSLPTTQSFQTFSPFCLLAPEHVTLLDKGQRKWEIKKTI